MYWNDVLDWYRNEEDDKVKVCVFYDIFDIKSIVRKNMIQSTLLKFHKQLDLIQGKMSGWLGKLLSVVLQTKRNAVSINDNHDFILIIHIY